MKYFVYRRWDGTQQPFNLKRKEVVDKFMENVMKGMSPNMSLAQMMWEGFSMAGRDFRVMGLEEMIDELQKQIEKLFSQFSLEKAFDKPTNALQSLLEDETLSRAGSGAPELPSFEDFDAGLLEKLYELGDIDFINEESREAYNYWRSRENDISDLYEFYSQYVHIFTGDKYLDFEEALELMRQFQALEQLQQQILSGDLSGIDPEKLQELLGDDAAQSFDVIIQLPGMISDEGILKADQGGVSMTPRGMRSLGELAFGKLYNHLKRDKQGGHLGNAPQTGEVEPDSSRPYEYGDRFDPDITRTILKAVKQGHRPGGDLQLSPDDFYVREREQMITSTTVVLLDLSWSMSFEGRFEAAKKVALALNHYIKTRFPKDKIHIVGFSTEARELKGNKLALAVWDVQRPFTNLQGGLRLAMKQIKKSGNRNNRVIVITDGQPTAYYIGTELHVELPDNRFGLSYNACRATLAEVRKVTAQGMNIEIFMLNQNPPLVAFSRQIAQTNGGRAVMCIPDELGKLVLVEEIKRRKR
ncbi:MAG: VWA domain-containing protein [Proteobacteria bacterium]|nr:VWA domain-containing protein [Pseudomonadota bacterium]